MRAGTLLFIAHLSAMLRRCQALCFVFSTNASSSHTTSVCVFTFNVIPSHKRGSFIVHNILGPLSLFQNLCHKVIIINLTVLRQFVLLEGHYTLPTGAVFLFPARRCFGTRPTRSLIVKTSSIKCYF